MALPINGPISLNQVRDELKLSGTISLGQKEVRHLSGMYNGSNSLKDLQGKSNSLWFKDIVDYYFENQYDFQIKRDDILAENNNDLSQKTFGFSDNSVYLENLFKETPITSTPKAIYANNVIRFDYLFAYCKYLTNISKELFVNCPKVEVFRYCFQKCQILTTIPEGLFDNNLEVKDFEYCFYENNSLTTVPYNLFDNCYKISLVSGCFSYDDNIRSSLPDAWNKEKFPNINKNGHSDYAYRCFFSRNYADIPEDWK